MSMKFSCFRKFPNADVTLSHPQGDEEFENHPRQHTRERRQFEKIS